MDTLNISTTTPTTDAKANKFTLLGLENEKTNASPSAGDLFVDEMAARAQPPPPGEMRG